MEDLWTRESSVESIVVKLNIHQKVTLRVLVLNFHSRDVERLYKRKRFERLLAAKAMSAEPPEHLLQCAIPHSLPLHSTRTHQPVFSV